MIISFLVVLFLSSTVTGRGGHSTRGGSHSYPKSSGYSGYGTGGGAHTSHSYPQSTGLSGNVNSAKVQQPYHQQHNTAQYNYSPKTEVHHHYHYSPPQHITYGSGYHPIYHGSPPIYVYEYRDSGSRFDSLLTGLALYNLGRHSQNHNYDTQREYSGIRGETCKLGISRRTGEYEETRIDCKLMSSFIWDDLNHPATTRNEQHITVEVTQTKETVHSSNSSGTTVMVKSETVVDALKVKGPSITVTPDMTCYMIRTVRDITTTRKPVDCGLLQEYARSSLYRNGSNCLMPVMTIIFNFLVYSVIY